MKKLPEISVVIPIDPRRKVEAIPTLKSQKHKIEIITESEGSAPHNRNIGARKAKGKYIAFVNMHTIVAENWSEKVLDFFEKHPDKDIVGGPHLSPKDESRFGVVSGYAFSSVFGAAGASSRYSGRKELLNASEIQLTSANLICKRKVIEKVQFDEDLYPGEDPNFITESKNQRFKVSYSPSILAYQYRRDNLKAMSKQIFHYGVARPNKESFLKTLCMPSFLVPPLFVVYLALLPILTYWNILAFIPFLAYIVLNLLFSLHQSLRNRDFKAIAILPLIFISIHVSYGLGFLWGILFGLKK